MAQQDSIDTGFPTWLDLELWAAYLKQRSRHKASNAAPTLDRILRKLDAWRIAGYDPNDIVGESLEKGWTGVFQPKALPGKPAQVLTFRERDLQRERERIGKLTGGLMGDAPSADVIDMEGVRVIR